MMHPVKKIKVVLSFLGILVVLYSSCDNNKRFTVNKDRLKTTDSLKNDRKDLKKAEQPKNQDVLKGQAIQTNNQIVSNIDTKLDTALLFGIWTIDPNGPHADFVLSKKSYYIVDYDGDGDIPYELKDNKLKIHFKDKMMVGKIVYLGTDSLKILWSNDTDTNTYFRWKN